MARLHAEAAHMLWRQRGLALIAVLWIVAALSVLVTALGHTVRQKAQAVGLTRHGVLAQALGDAAVHVALQRLAALPRPPDGLVEDIVSHDGAEVLVSVRPLDGLIDLNNASVELLSQALHVGAEMPVAQADLLAQDLVDWRRQPTAGGGVARFESPEDLLLVPGLKYAVYARIRSMVTTDLAGDGRVNPMAASPEVLRVLARGDQAGVQRILSGRQAGQPGLDLTVLDARFIRTGGASGRYLVSATVPVDDARSYVFTRVVIAGTSNDRGVPWRTVATRREVRAAPQPD